MIKTNPLKRRARPLSQRSVILGSLASMALLAGGCASSAPDGPGAATFTLLNDSSATLDVEMITLPGQPTMTVQPGGATESSITPETDTRNGVLELVLVPMDEESGGIGRPARVELDQPPYRMRVFGTAKALRWARIIEAPDTRSNDLTLPPPPNPGAGIQAR